MFLLRFFYLQDSFQYYKILNIVLCVYGRSLLVIYFIYILYYLVEFYLNFLVYGCCASDEMKHFRAESMT